MTAYNIIIYVHEPTVLYLTLLHLPPLRFHYADGCWDCADGCWDCADDGCWLILFAADGLAAVAILEPLLLLVSLLLLASLISLASLLLLVSLLLLASLVLFASLIMQAPLLLLVLLLAPQLFLMNLMLLAFLLLLSFCALCHYFPFHLTFGARIPTILPYLLLLAFSLWLDSLLMGHVIAGVAIVAGVPDTVLCRGISAAVAVHEISAVVFVSLR